jgi:hypothetical protein
MFSKYLFSFFITLKKIFNNRYQFNLRFKKRLDWFHSINDEYFCYYSTIFIIGICSLPNDRRISNSLYSKKMKHTHNLEVDHQHFEP